MVKSASVKNKAVEFAGKSRYIKDGGSKGEAKANGKKK